MQLVNCQVAIGGDLNNKGVKTKITPAEVQVLRMIHGAGSISDVEIVEKLPTAKYSQESIYTELKYLYPTHSAKVQEYWRDNGAKFPTDIRELGLPEGAFRLPIDMQIERLNGKAAKPGRPRKLGRTEEELESQAAGQPVDDPFEPGEE